MYQRDALKVGETISLDFESIVRELKIEELLGEGGSCLVYKVRSVETDSLMILKEFYPAYEGFAIWREGTVLRFSENTEKDRRFQRMKSYFSSSYERLREFSSTEQTQAVNYTVKIIPEGFSEDNGTLYIPQVCRRGERTLQTGNNQ